MTVQAFGWQDMPAMIAAAQNLVNALEAENHMSKEEPKIDIKGERVDPVSIWKDVSELPKWHCQAFVKFKNHCNIFIYDCEASSIIDLNGDQMDLDMVESWCLLQDFINSFEQMQKDIEELKRKI